VTPLAIKSGVAGAGCGKTVQIRQVSHVPPEPALIALINAFEPLELLFRDTSSSQGSSGRNWLYLRPDMYFTVLLGLRIHKVPIKR
jgi:hypothetical protein